MPEWISWLSALCSIGGAMWSISQAKRARNSASLAESIKSQLISHRKVSELVELQVLLNYAQKSFEKYGSSSPDSLKGIDQNADATVVVQFANRLKLFREYFPDINKNAADHTYDELNELLNKFKDTKDTKEISVYGSRMLMSIVSFSSHLRRELSGQRESIFGL